jgi:hypothetical protein
MLMEYLFWMGYPNVIDYSFQMAYLIPMQNITTVSWHNVFDAWFGWDHANANENSILGYEIPWVIGLDCPGH